MTSRSVEIRELRIPLEAVKRLSNETRFSYYLLGHIFNELMALQKIVAFAMPKHDDHRPARLRAEVAQVLFLFRLASGKIWEAHKAINEKEVAAMLRDCVLPKLAGGVDRLKAVNKAVNDAIWLSPLRNGLGFHFPTYKEWAPYVTPEEGWEDDLIFLGDKSGNTFYDASATTVQHWMFALYGLSDPKDAIDPLVKEMIDLLRMMNGFLEDTLATVVSEVLLESKGQSSATSKVVAPEFERVSIPFWTWMPSRAD